jgi:hypothetical protein
MGFRTVDDVLDNAPEDLTPAERLVLVVLAGYADDGNRECWPGRDHLIRRTGLKEDSLRKVFQRLAKRGLDPRVPIGTDKSGRLVFAYEGARTKYRVPKFATEWRDDNPATDPEAGSASPLSSLRGGTTVPQRRESDPSEAGPPSRPNHQEPSRTSLSVSTSTPDRVAPPGPPEEREIPATPTKNNGTTAASRAVRASGAVPEDQEQAFIDWITDKYQPRGPGWWRTSAADLPELADLWRASQNSVTPTQPAGRQLPPVCPRCEAESSAARFNANFRIHDDGPCTACHPDAMPAAA